MPAKHLERGIGVQSQPGLRDSIVRAGGKVWVQRRLAVAGVGPWGYDGARDFRRSLESLCAMQVYNTMVALTGVVLDDSGAHVVAFLHELPGLCTMLSSAFTRADVFDMRWSWRVREAWTRDIVTAICHVHSRGLVVGVVGLTLFGIRSNGRVVLTNFRNSGREFQKLLGALPPELKNIGTLPAHLLNSQTDIC
ncbi:hypothetical protein BAUCODRAFT_467620 [Baudoinia panamericana UAMH 10762]|uniref:Protein kinase domain-containing protein n=1 Tax=Baudoinia panamericana (strain UAMH 10762) TaxID=717646 RepID=M2NAR4_BAUPA|nr:uncharacterized protein BAUCODRAFT_467620 [Baudoinia panamericana UAMH 10762]EMC96234.1 hypothetical protein BAUCODRAFT_467620 [Baudoinia panamericana UAMH 10762]